MYAQFTNKIIKLLSHCIKEFQETIRVMLREAMLKEQDNTLPVNSMYITNTLPSVVHADPQSLSQQLIIVCDCHLIPYKIVYN